MRLSVFGRCVCALIFGVPLVVRAQNAASAPSENPSATIEAHLAMATKTRGKGTPQSNPRRIPPAVLWLRPLSKAPVFWPAVEQHRYTLLQKNKMFLPHLLVVPVGSLVSFPNEDPFFHNVFSLFDGKRFDLGLYEAGSTREVRFSREGISYIFCNIHPDMSAVVIALTTPWFAVSDASGLLRLQAPEGTYEAHLWVEGMPQDELDTWAHVVHIGPGHNDLGVIPVSVDKSLAHRNKFGQSYTDPTKIY